MTRRLWRKVWEKFFFGYPAACGGVLHFSFRDQELLHGDCPDDCFFQCLLLRYSTVSYKGTSKNLLRASIASLGGVRNPHALHIRPGFCAPSAFSDKSGS